MKQRSVLRRVGVGLSNNLERDAVEHVLQGNLGGKMCYYDIPVAHIFSSGNRGCVIAHDLHRRSLNLVLWETWYEAQTDGT